MNVMYPINSWIHCDETWAYWESIFSEYELQKIRLLASDPAAHQAAVGSTDLMNASQGHGINPDIRRSQLNWLSPDNNEYIWVFERLSYFVAKLNDMVFNFDITGFGEGIQLTNYSSQDKGFYGWHTDKGQDGLNRKLSLVVQLTNPDEYEGGELQLQDMYSDNIHTVPKKQGYLTVFPSWVKHQVTPVTKGHRQSLVAWITGPRLR